MSKLVNIGTFCGGLGGLLAGGLGVFSLATGSTSIETPDDLISALGQIEAAIRESQLVIDESSSVQLEQALDTFTGQVVLAAQESAQTFVFKSFSGVVDYPHGTPVDFVAPNNESRLMVFRAHASPDVTVTADGDDVSNLRKGENVIIDFGSQSCKFELIDMKTSEFVRVRSKCK